MTDERGAGSDTREDRPARTPADRTPGGDVRTGAPFRLTFEDLWTTPPDPDRALLATLPRMGAATPENPQVLVPDVTPPHSLPAGAGTVRQRPPVPVRLDALETTPWVTSVVAQVPVEATRPIGQVTELFVPGMSLHEPDERTLANLPNLERLVMANVRPDLLAEHAALKDAYIGWLPQRSPSTALWASDGLAAVARLRGLERLRIRWCPTEAVSPLTDLGGLRWLAVEGLRDHRTLGALTGLERLEVRGVSVASFRPWRELTRLRRLAAYGRVGTLAGLEGMGALEDLAITTSRIADLGPMAGLAALRRLWLWTRGLPDTAPLARLEALEEVALHVAETPDLAPLTGHLRRLRRLELHLVGELVAPIPSLSFMEGLESLEEVVLGNALPAGASLDALAGLPRLRRLIVSGHAAPDLATFRRRRPDVIVDGWWVTEPVGRRYVGRVHYDAPRDGAPDWFILQDLAEDLGVETNYAAERLIRAALRARDESLVRRLTWDTEGGAVGVSARSEADVRAVAEVIAALIVERRDRPA